MEVHMIDLNQILDLELPQNDAGAKTIREYLCRLLLKLWQEDEGFSGKRPFGNSGWYYDLVGTILDSGIASDEKEARYIVESAIIEMCS
jgi:hypothetical protein